MEPRFGADFSGVRVHSGGEAAALNHDFKAQAFTRQRDIYFGSGKYNPESSTGQRLLAHELTHVVQQSQSTTRGLNPNSEIQREPDEENGVLPAASGTQPTEATETTEPLSQTRPRSEFFYFGTYQTGYYEISNDREFMRYEMTRLIADKGLTPALHWIILLNSRQGQAIDDAPRPFLAHTIATRRRVRSPLDAQRDAERDPVRQRVAPDAIPLTNEVFWQIYLEAKEFLIFFEERGRAITSSLLDTSEERVNAERVRYGLERTEVLPPDWSVDEFGQPERPYSTYSHTMSADGPSTGLRGAAMDLKAKRDTIQSLRTQRLRLYRLSGSILAGNEMSIPPENQSEYESLTQRIDAAETEYDVLRSVYENRYPILARFAEDPSAIETIAQGTGSRTAAILNEQIYETLNNIANVRRELRPNGRVKIWKLPEIVHLTKAATQATGDTITGRMRSKIVDDKQQQVEDEEFWRNITLGALAIGLGLLAAIPTGGSSLAAGVAAFAALGSLGLNVYIASESLQEYNLQQAMSGSDFDRAKAISSEDPSLFWLAVDIIGAAFEVGPALRATRTAMVAARTSFRTLAPLARRAITAQGSELAESLAAIRRAAANEELGEAVVQSVQSLRRGTDVQEAIGRAAGHEAAARAGLSADSLGQSATTVIGRHTIHVAPGTGALVMCSQCIWIRGMFSTELGDNASHLRRLESLEEQARIAAASEDAASATRIAEETRQLADELLALRRSRLRGTVRALTASEIEEFRRLRSLNPADMNQEEIEALQRLRETSGEAFGGRLVSNTPDHKAERWLEYQSRGGKLRYESWSRIYQQNMERARRSHRLVEAHIAQLGWGKSQVVRTPFGDSGPRRILDIAEEAPLIDPLTGRRVLIRAVEHKEGYITMSDAIRAEIRADKQLARDGAQISWYIDGRASQGVRDALSGPPPPPIPLQEMRPNLPT
jgi:hypothetical protein